MLLKSPLGSGQLGKKEHFCHGQSYESTDSANIASQIPVFMQDDNKKGIVAGLKGYKLRTELSVFP